MTYRWSRRSAGTESPLEPEQSHGDMLAGDDELSSYCRVDVLERTYRKWREVGAGAGVGSVAFGSWVCNECGCLNSEIHDACSACGYPL